MTEIVNILQIVYDATMAIQNPFFTLSDFYCFWIRIQVRLQRWKATAEQLTELPDVLLENLKQRKTALLDHPAMLCAIFLDPRVHKELEREGDSAVQIAKIALTNLNARISSSKTKNSAQNVSNQDNSLEEYFDTQVQIERNDEQSQRTEFMESLDHFHRSIHYMKLEPKQTILEFWEENKSLFPALYEVACIINAIPPSQATVERAFSALKYIFTEHRTRLDQDRLENLLMIKLNPDLAESVNQNNIDAIREKYNRRNS